MYSNKITPIPLYIQLMQLVKNIFQDFKSPGGFSRCLKLYLLKCLGLW